MSDKRTINMTNPLRRFAEKLRLKERTRVVTTWCRENPQLALTITATVVSLGGAFVKGGIRHHNTREQERVKTEYCYDPSEGHYWPLRKKLTTSQWLTVSRRKEKGEKLADILASMKVLK